MEHSPEHTHEFDAAAASEDPTLGAVIGNYHVLAKLGAGSFGKVYKARDLKLGRTVALKMMRYPAESTARGRLEHEAQLLAKLGHHPSVVAVYAWGEHEQEAFFALEFLPSSAADLLAREPSGMSPKRVASIMLDCARGLQFAHENGILHGDIKPANILIDGSSNRAKLCDFGMARWRDSIDENQGATGGSPSYMAPELLEGIAPDARTDIYALGVTAFQLLTGALPYAAPPIERLRDPIATAKSETLRALPLDCPAVLTRLVERCMQPDPAQRPADAESLVRDLEGIVSGGQTAAPRQRPALRTWAVVGAAALAVALAAVFIPALPQRGESADDVVLAEAHELLETGRYADARHAYERLLSQSPELDEARYGLGFAMIFEGQTARAANVFQGLDNLSMNREGQAAVAYAQQKERSRDELRTLLDEGASGYAAVLASAVDMAYGDHTTALETLSKLDAATLAFDWQRAKYFQLLGQAYFRLGHIALAREAFERLNAMTRTPAALLAGDFIEMTDAQLKSDQTEKLSAQIARLREVMEQSPEPRSDDWTSRPIRLWILPPDTSNSAVAQETGLAEVLPWRLAASLMQQDELPVDVVEREAISTLLAEQELSAQLSSERDAIGLGKLYGARFALLGAFTSLAGEETVDMKIVDVETSRVVPVESQSLDRTFEPQPFFEAITDKVIRALRKAQPIRGMLTASSGEFRINIGRTVGVQPGMRFRVMTQPGESHTIPNVYADVIAPLAEGYAIVQFEGMPIEAVPDSGWYVEAISISGEPPDA